MTDKRSASAREADRIQERVVFGGRVLVVWCLAVILAVGVGISTWQEVPMIYIVTGIAGWVVVSLHLSLTAILHELYELNDQVAGRKDEFRELINGKPRVAARKNGGMIRQVPEVNGLFRHRKRGYLPRPSGASAAK